MQFLSWENAACGYGVHKHNLIEGDHGQLAPWVVMWTTFIVSVMINRQSGKRSRRRSTLPTDGGTAKQQSYRHAGTDVSTVVDKAGYKKIVVDQSYYVEGLQDVDIPADRIRQNVEMGQSEIGACRTALGVLQWLAVQSQPQLASRCNLLLTELVTVSRMETAREIQEMISEVRRENFQLQFFKFPTAEHWTDIVFVSMSDHKLTATVQRATAQAVWSRLLQARNVSKARCAAWHSWPGEPGN